MNVTRVASRMTRSQNVMTWGQRFSGRGNSRGKGPGAGTSSVGRCRKKANAAELSKVGRWGRDQGRKKRDQEPQVNSVNPEGKRKKWPTGRK